jgi:hypothetical protein
VFDGKDGYENKHYFVLYIANHIVHFTKVIFLIILGHNNLLYVLGSVRFKEVLLYS